MRTTQRQMENALQALNCTSLKKLYKIEQWNGLYHLFTKDRYKVFTTETKREMKEKIIAILNYIEAEEK